MKRTFVKVEDLEAASSRLQAMTSKIVEKFSHPYGIRSTCFLHIPRILVFGKVSTT